MCWGSAEWVGGGCVGLSVLGGGLALDLGLRPRLFCVGPSALGATARAKARARAATRAKGKSKGKSKSKGKGKGKGKG